MLREKNSVNSEIVYPAKISFKNVNEIKMFLGKSYCHHNAIKEMLSDFYNPKRNKMRIFRKVLRGSEM